MCRCKIPLTEIKAIFALSESHRMGARLHLPSLVDEFVCDANEGEDYMKASNQFIGKIANKFRADFNIPFACHNDVALTWQKIPDGIPNDLQAKDIKHHITRVILHHTSAYEGLCLCRLCPFCMRRTPAALTRCLNRFAEMVLVGRFMDQSHSSLGSPRSLDPSTSRSRSSQPTNKSPCKTSKMKNCNTLR